MSNNEQENPFENSIGKLSRYFSNSDDATQLLVGNLVTFLIEKKVIDLNEYIEFTENSKNRILEKIENCITISEKMLSDSKIINYPETIKEDFQLIDFSLLKTGLESINQFY